VTRLTLYGKPGCHLCEEARRAVVAAGRERDFDLEEVDVSADPALQRVYGERIPVLAVDGEVAFELGVDPEDLLRRLDTVQEP
jgi:glutaredoxin